MDHDRNARNVETNNDTLTYESPVLIILWIAQKPLFWMSCFARTKIQVYNLNASILIIFKIVLYLQDKYPPTALL